MFHLLDITSRRSAVLAELRDFAAGKAHDLSHPGSGKTWHRFEVLASWAAKDLSLGRLVEGHADALSILAECQRTESTSSTYGVWAARPPIGGTKADRVRGGWQLSRHQTILFGQRPTRPGIGHCGGTGRIPAIRHLRCRSGHLCAALLLAGGRHGRLAERIARIRGPGCSQAKCDWWARVSTSNDLGSGSAPPGWRLVGSAEQAPCWNQSGRHFRRNPASTRSPIWVAPSPWSTGCGWS